MTGLLFPLRTVTDDDEQEIPAPSAAAGPPADGAEPLPAQAPLVLLEGGRMGWRDQCVAAVAHSLRVARHRSRELAEREGGLARSALAGKSPSVAEQNDYARSRAWVPPGHDGGILEGMGVIYHALAGRPGVACAQAWGWLWSRPFHSVAAACLTLAVTITVLAVTGHDLAAWLTGLAAVLLTAGWAAAGALLMRLLGPRREIPQPPPAFDDETEEF